ncbi:MAG: hypothetical protein CEE42_09250 [Promethearchaeota archaeon Loki_b31]|nr:MAG: hypothetical protein CEE42_09250 [Candidatus Lokiarchaeota archaeon Loki_b31]
MGLISGLKGLFKKPIFVFIISLFTITWILIILNSYLLIPAIKSFIFMFGGGLLLFNLIFLFISLFKNLDKINKWFYIIIFIVAIALGIFFSASIFSTTFILFFLILLNVNIFFTAFFAFKLCMDSSTKVDDYLYKSKSSRKVTRVIEFLVFSFLVLWFFRLTVIFFSYTSLPLLLVVIQILQTLFWINVVLMIIVLIRLIITKKLSAYITLFFLFTFFYALYILFDLLYGIFFSTATGDPTHVIVSFVIDAALFAYILGTVYDKIEFIQDKLKVFRVDTIALFLITMKIYVQISRIGAIIVPVAVQILQAQVLFIIFVFFNLIFGMYSILAHKSKKSKR